MERCGWIVTPGSRETEPRLHRLNVSHPVRHLPFRHVLFMFHCATEIVQPQRPDTPASRCPSVLMLAVVAGAPRGYLAEKLADPLGCSGVDQAPAMAMMVNRTRRIA